MSGLALGIGPTVGGILVTAVGWRWVFFINVPIGALCLLLGVRALAESTNPAARRLDLPGQATSVLWVGALAYGFVERGTNPWGATLVWLPLTIAAASLGAFLAIEHRSGEPMLPLSLFRFRLFCATALLTFLLGFVIISVPFFTTQYFQDVQHFSALDSGVRVLAFSLMFSVAAPFAGRLSGRFGFRVPVIAGALTSSVGLFFLSAIAPHSPYADVFWRLSLVGIGFGLMLSPLSTAALNSVHPDRQDSRRAWPTRRVRPAPWSASRCWARSSRQERCTPRRRHYPPSPPVKPRAWLRRSGTRVPRPNCQRHSPGGSARQNCTRSPPTRT